MSLIWRYSSKMAMVFFSTSSSVMAGLLGVCGGGGVAEVSRFTAHADTQDAERIIQR